MMTYCEHMPFAAGRCRRRDGVLACSAWLASALIFFRHAWATGFTSITGNAGDTRLAVYLDEHWFLVLRGRASWLNPQFFYPAKGVLGWSDTFFLYQIFYAPFRILGADEFLAFQLTVISASLVGFIGFVVLAKQLFDSPIGIAIAGAWLFTFANNLALHAGSAQLLGVYFLPAIASVGVGAWRALDERPLWSAVLFAVFGLGYGALLFSFYYVSWLSIVSALVLLVVRVALSPRSIVVPAARRLVAGWRPPLAGVCAFCVFFVPFLRVYLPAVREFGGRSYGAVLYYAPTWTDFFSLGRNLYWSRIQDQIRQSFESSYAITPLFFVLVVLVGPVLVWRYRLFEQRSRTLLTIALCVTTLLLMILPVKTSYGSLWIVVWHLPGANGIRASYRLEIVTGLIAALAFTSLATGVVRRWQRGPRPPVTLLALGILVVIAVCCEQLNVSPLAQISRPQQLALLDAVPSPPKQCTSFFVTDSVHRSDPYYVYQIDAILIAQKLDIPTLNGYSGETPHHYGMLFTESNSYLVDVEQWVVRNHIRSGVCELDLGHMTWLDIDQTTRLDIGQATRLDIGQTTWLDAGHVTGNVLSARTANVMAASAITTASVGATRATSRDGRSRARPA